MSRRWPPSAALALSATAPREPELDDRILYLGMTGSAAGESRDVEETRELLHALRDLDPKVIEEGWCGHA